MELEGSSPVHKSLTYILPLASCINFKSLCPVSFRFILVFFFYLHVVFLNGLFTSWVSGKIVSIGHLCNICHVSMVNINNVLLESQLIYVEKIT